MDGELFVGTDVSLCSSLLQELCQGLQGLVVTFPSRALAGLPGPLSRTGVHHLTSLAEGPAASAQANCVLRHCITVTSLDCSPGFWPHFWPPNLTALNLNGPEPPEDEAEPASVTEITEMQHVQLMRLQDVSKLQQPRLLTGPVCKWPAALVRAWPGSLQKVHVSVPTEDGDQRLAPPGALDLTPFSLASASSKATSCTAELNISVYNLWDFSAEEAWVAGVLAGLRAVCSFRTLRLQTSGACVDEHHPAMSQPERECCVLEILGGPSHFEQLPALRHVTIISDNATDLVIEWAALASPGVRCLDFACQLIFTMTTEGCSGLPPSGRPWALAIWADMSRVQGLPASSFMEEAPGMHVWRNAAGAGLVV